MAEDSRRFEGRLRLGSWQQTEARVCCRLEKKKGALQRLFRVASAACGVCEYERANIWLYLFGWRVLSHASLIILPALRRRLVESESLFDATRRLFDLGCGNGSVAAALATDGYEVSGVDPSTDGIAQANKAYPAIRLEVGSGYDDLKNRFGQFPCVYCLEVIEHVYDPRRLLRTVSHS